MGSDKQDYTLGISILEQALANLTAVVSASALDIRALDSSDKAHVGIPYDTVTYKDSDVSVANNDNADITFTKTDWGESVNWVTYIINITLYNITTDFMTKKAQGFRIAVFNDSDDLAISETFSAEVYRPLLENTVYLISKTVYIVGGFYSANAQTLHVKIFNYTGQTLVIDARITGVPI